MRYLASSWLLLLILGCGGPQNRYAETPTAKTRATPTVAPGGGPSDEDREQLIQQFDDMRAGQQAHEEANRASAPPPGPPPTGAPPGMSPPPKKVGPAEQAPMPPKKKVGPAEQAPSQPR